MNFIKDYDGTYNEIKISEKILRSNELNLVKAFTFSMILKNITVTK
jgi:hypothetical protein